MLKIGITGGIGSGKSVISKLISLMGIPVYIADIESKKLTATSPVIREKLIASFGADLYDGEILNKKLLASYIFNDKEKLKTVNSIIHPEVIKNYKKWLDKHQDYPVTAHEAAILYETGIDKLMDKVLVVYAPLDVRIRRVTERDNLSEKEVMERVRNQMPDEEKIKSADFIIYNNDKKSLIGQVLAILEQLNYTT